MPIISLTQKDIDSRKKPTPGFHLVQIESIEEKPSKDKKSTNYNIEMVVLQEGQNNGRVIRDNVNSKMPGMWVPILAAVNGISEDEVKGQDVDTDLLVGKPFIIEAKEEIYNDKINVKVAAYHPKSLMASIDLEM